MSTELAAELAAHRASGVKLSKLRAVQVVCRHDRELLSIYRLGGGQLAVEYRHPVMRNLPPTLDDIEGRGDGEVQKAPPKNSRDPVVRSAESLGLWQEIDGDPLDFMFYTSNECCSVKLGTVFLASQIRAADDRRRNVRVVAPAAC